MPKVLPIQNDFTAGILTPRMHSRTDIEGYARGVADCVNMVTLKQGPVQKRRGTRFLQTLGGSNHRLFSMQMFADNQIGEAFAILIDENELSVIGATGLTSGKEIVNNSAFAGGLSPWQSNATGSAAVTWTSGGVRLKAGQTTVANSQYCEVSQQVSISAGKENEIHRVSAVSIPEGYTIPMLANIRVGTSRGANNLYSGTGSGEFNPNGNSTVWLTIRAYSNPFDRGGSGGEPSISYDSLVTVTSASIVETENSEIKFEHGWTSDEVNKLRVAQNPEIERLYFASGDSSPRELTYDPVDNEWAFGNIGFAGMPTEWTDSDGWPSTMTFYQGRSWWSGHKDYPNRVWGSKSKTSATSYFDMTVGTQDDDAIDITISKRGKVVWMEPLGNTMIVGTTDAEFALVSEGGVVTPSDNGFEEQSNNGSGQTQPTKAGNFVLYSSSDGRKLFSLIYRWTENAWRSRDMTFTAEHLTRGSSITHITYTKNPENVVWLVTATNELIGCTFDPTTELLGWHRHNIGDEVMDMASIETRGTSALFMIVRRELNNQSVYTLEYLDFSSDVYLDSFVQFTDTDSISMPHLAGETVKVVADGYVVPDVTLDDDGNAELQLDTTPASVSVGIPFTASLTTLPAEAGYPIGSMVTLPKRWNKVSAYLTDSALPLIEGQRPRDRSFDSAMDLPEPLTTGLVHVTLTGYQKLGQITIESDIPLSFTLNAIMGELNASNT
ncbi:tail tubular protein [Alteromonas phage ZP6]|uniref:Uncharacterized protein n=1 Tax=Alteromonas phage ZP6 TaxID=2492447 RepID=A0A3S9U8A2_9CAUD|nr:tail protein [Alteromonas phage ZP6]AZS06561.1 tail tubular protein [Alteromonas phage ZP6]